MIKSWPDTLYEMTNEGKSPAGGKVKSVLTRGSMWSWKTVKDTLSLQPNSSPTIELTRSLIVSVIALIVDFSTLVFTKEKLGINYLVAATLGFLAGVVVNYILSVRWVFTKRQLASKHIEFAIFVVICGVGLALNLLIIAGLVEWLSFDYRIAKLIAVILVFFWNFLMRKKVLY